MFYDNILLHQYKRYKKGEISNPYGSAIGLISFCQLTHIVLIIILLDLIFKFGITAFLREYFLTFLILTYLIIMTINFYIYYLSKRKNKILKKRVMLSKYFKFYILLYIILSISSPLLVIYLRDYLSL